MLEPQPPRRARKTNPKEASSSSRIYTQVTPDYIDPHFKPKAQDQYQKFEPSKALETLEQPVEISKSNQYSELSESHSSSDYVTQENSQKVDPPNSDWPLSLAILSSQEDTQRESSLASESDSITLRHTIDNLTSDIYLKYLTTDGQAFSRFGLSSNCQFEPSDVPFTQYIDSIISEGLVKIIESESKKYFNELTISKNTLVVIHPVLRSGNQSRQDCIFPYIKESEEGEKTLSVKKVVIFCGEYQNISCAVEDLGNFEQYKTTFKSSMENQKLQLYQYQVDDGFQSQQASENLEFQSFNHNYTSADLINSDIASSQEYSTYQPNLSGIQSDYPCSDTVPVSIEDTILTPNQQNSVQYIVIQQESGEPLIYKIQPSNLSTFVESTVQLDDSNFETLEFSNQTSSVSTSNETLTLHSGISNPSQSTPYYTPSQIETASENNCQSQQVVYNFPNLSKETPLKIKTPIVPINATSLVANEQTTPIALSNGYPSLQSSSNVKQIETPSSSTIKALNNNPSQPSPRLSTFNVINIKNPNGQTPKYIELSPSVPVQQIIVSENPVTNIQNGQVKQQGDKPNRPQQIPGYVIVCKNCGLPTFNLHFCNYCKVKLPYEAKVVPDTYKSSPISSPKINSPITMNKKPFSEPTVSDQSHSPTVPISNKRSGGGGKKNKLESTTPRKIKGRKQEECIVISSDDEDKPKSKFLKMEKDHLALSTPSSCSNSPVESSPVKFTGGENLPPGITKTVQVNLTKLPESPNKIRAPQIMMNLSHFDKTSTANENTITHSCSLSPEQVIEKLENIGSGSQGQGQFTTISCRSIRVGDYKCALLSSLANSYSVTFAECGIYFNMPHATNKSKIVKCAIPIDCILNITAHFRQRLPVMFINCGPKIAKWIRTELGLSKQAEDGNFYCPLNGNPYQKHIIFISEIVDDLAAGTIKRIHSTTLTEIDYMKANEFLMSMTSPQDGNKSTNVKRSTQTVDTNPNIIENSTSLTCKAHSQTVVISSCLANCLKPKEEVEDIKQIDVSANKTILSYKGITILQQDILCLAVEQFLNDSILDFWMRYLEHEVLTPEDRARTYMFSTFFYKRLTTRPRKRGGTLEDDSNLSNSEKRHARVKRWTKKVDIFEKDFIVVPINENCHWFLAVICYPGLIGAHDMETGELIPEYSSTRGLKAKAKILLKTIDSSQSKSDSSYSKSGDASSSQDSIEPPVPSLDLTTPVLVKQESDSVESVKIRIKQPCIWILDSLAGETRSRVYSTLREYLKMEYKTRKGEDREFTKLSMPGYMPKVPQQPNHCDCGIFTLFYVECFFKYPLATYEIPTDPDLCKEWFPVVWDTMRERIYDYVKRLVEKESPENVALIPKLAFPRPQKKVKVSREKMLEQIQAAPIAKVEQIKPEDEPMDVDVDIPPTDQNVAKSSKNTCIQPTLIPTVSEMARASDHDHDYVPIPCSLKSGVK